MSKSIQHTKVIQDSYKASRTDKTFNSSSAFPFYCFSFSSEKTNTVSRYSNPPTPNLQEVPSNSKTNEQYLYYYSYSE